MATGWKLLRLLAAGEFELMTKDTRSPDDKTGKISIVLVNSVIVCL